MHQLSRPRSSARLPLTLAALLACTLTPSLATAGDIETVAAGGLVTLHSPGSDGGLERYATGGGLALMLIDADDDVSLGGSLQVNFLGGQDGRRIYDLGVSFIISYGLEDALATPYMRLGLDLAGASADDLDRDRARSIMTGVHGAAGLHGFFSDEKLYWRAELGFLGAGPGGVTTQLSLGYNFGEF